MVAEWFVLANNQPVGPYTQDTLLGFMQQGSVVPSSFVRRLDGPWMTAAHAYAQIAATMAPSGAAQPAIPSVSYSAPVAPSAPSMSVASSFAAQHRKRTWSWIASSIVLVSSIVFGGAGAVYIYKNFGSILKPPPAKQLEPQIIVIEQPPKLQPGERDVSTPSTAP